MTRALRALVLCAVVLWAGAPGWAQAQPAEDQPTADQPDKDQPDKDQPAKAEPTKEELAAARALFRSAMEDEKVGNWLSALEKVTKVSKVKMTPQVRYHLALCHEHLGHLVEAINGFEIAEQEARAAEPKAKNVAINAPARAEKLRARVAHVTITVKGTIRTSKILMDDKPISMALLETDIPIDPGKHVLQIRRDGKVQYERTLELGEGADEQIELEIDDPEPGPRKPKPVKPKPAPDPPSPAPGWVLASLGAAAIAVGGVMWVLREDTIETVRAGCEPGDVKCDPADVDTAQLGKTYSIVSYVTWAAGGAALVTGIALIIALTPTDEPQADAEAAPGGGSDKSAAEAAKKPEPVSLTIAPTLTGLQISGRF